MLMALVQPQPIGGGGVEKRCLGFAMAFAQRLPFGFKFGAEKFLELLYVRGFVRHDFHLEKPRQNRARKQAHRDAGVWPGSRNGAAGGTLELGDKVIRASGESEMEVVNAFANVARGKSRFWIRVVSEIQLQLTGIGQGRVINTAATREIYSEELYETKKCFEPDWY
jgi:hypothetical protein